MKTLNEVIQSMYHQICFAPGQRPNWHEQNEIFAPNARMVRVNDEGIFEFNLQSYRKNFEEMIDNGTLPSFWEAEIWREERVFEDVAHVLSAYETRYSKDGELLNRGVNSIQLFRKDGHWYISAMIWRREGTRFVLETR